MGKAKKTFLQGKMNKDVDERLLPETEYPHAENVRVNDSGDQHIGAIENVLGNNRLSDLGLTKGCTIGALADDTNQKIYYFVTSDDKDLVVEFDDLNKVVEVVLESSKPNGTLNFNRNYLITGVNKINNTDKSRDLLLWTDDYNPPRVVNIERGKTYGLDGFSEEDISTIKTPPVYPPNLVPQNTLEQLENNLENKFLAFSYRYKTLDGFYTATSPFTDYFFIPGSFRLDYDTTENLGMVNSYNSVRVDFNTGDERVTDVELLVKFSNSNTIWIVEKFNKNSYGWGDNQTESYTFTNSKLYQALPEDEIKRLYDNVPRKAKAQDMAGNRVIYGNFLEQYDIKDVDGNKILIDYNLTLKSNSLAGDPIPVETSESTPGTQDLIELDLTGIDLTSGASLELIVDLRAEDIDGRYRNTFNFLLTRDYTSVAELVADPDFIAFVNNTMTNAFLINYIAEEEPDSSVIISNSNFEIIYTSGNTFFIQAPTITYQIDNTPDNPNDNDFTDQVVAWEYFTTGVSASYYLVGVGASLKSNRSNEIGLVYKDSQGRATTVLTSLDNTLYIPHRNSVNQNKIVVSVNHKPPYWADRYCFAIKQNKGRYHTIYGTLFYEDGIYRWIRLEGNNKDKVKEGDTLIVKSDLDGVVDEVVEIKVLQLTTQVRDFIEDNVDSNDTEIKEFPGLYIKIKSSGALNINTDSYNYVNAEGSCKTKTGKPSTLLTEGSSGVFGAYIPILGGGFFGTFGDFFSTQTQLNDYKDSVESNPAFVLKSTLAGYKDSVTGLFVDYEMTPGSRVNVYFHNYESDGYSEIYEKQFVVQSNYSNFQEWWEAEVIDLGNKSDKFAWVFLRDPETNGLGLWVQGSESGASAERSKLYCKIEITLSTGILIFETKPDDKPEEIFYEGSDVFLIRDGVHQGNIQNQSSDYSLPAECELSFHDCYAFGNGVESTSYKDGFNTNWLNVDLRPNSTSIEEYKEVRRYADLTYSDLYNEGSNVNRLNEFNLGTANFKDDIEKRYGSIQKIVARDTDLLIFQEDKISKVLYGKAILTNIDGTGNPGQTKDVLGQQVTVPGEYGISLNPESYAKFGNNIYFVDTKRGTPMRLSMSGLDEINYGMSTYFKDLFSRSLFNKKVGAYDPNNDQYVILPSGDSINTIIETSCGKTFRRVNFNGTQEIFINFDTLIGDIVVNYNVTGKPVRFTLEWNGNTIDSGFIGDEAYNVNLINAGYSPVSDTGSGSISLDKDLLTPTEAKLTIFAPFDDSEYEVSSTCILTETLNVVNIVTNDQEDAGKTLISRYKWYRPEYTSSNKNYIIPFDPSGLTVFSTLTGQQGSGFIPISGSTIRLEMKKDYTKTGVIDTLDRLGYLVSNTQYLPSDLPTIMSLATFVSKTTVVDSNGDITAYIEFPFDNPMDESYLYLIWDYNTPPTAVDDENFVEIGEDVIINVMDNDLGDLTNWTPVIVTPPINGTVVVNPDKTITYSHGGLNQDPDSFTYKLTNPSGRESNTATVSLTVAIGCNGTFAYSGTQGIFEFEIGFGLSTGECGISYQAYTIPDKFEIIYNGEVVATTNTAVSGSGVLTFIKNTPTPATATVRVTATSAGTAWNVGGICPTPSVERISADNTVLSADNNEISADN